MNLPTEPFTTANLAEVGLTRKLLRSQLAAGSVKRYLQGVYGDASLPDTVETRIAAAALVTAHYHILIDRSAAWVHGVDCYGAAELAAGVPIEMCAEADAHRTQRSDVSGHERELGPHEVMSLGPIRVTTPLRTALDLGCHLRRREAYAAMCELARLHDLTVSALVGQVGRFAGRRGVVQLRELAPLVDPRFESQREAWTYLAIHDAGLPHPEPQVWVNDAGEPLFRLDLAYPMARVCVEYNGKEAHEMTPEQIAHDRWRLGWLRDHGWTVIVVRSGDFTGAALDRWLHEIREALGTPYTSRRW